MNKTDHAVKEMLGRETPQDDRSVNIYEDKKPRAIAKKYQRMQSALEEAVTLIESEYCSHEHGDIEHCYAKNQIEALNYDPLDER